MNLAKLRFLFWLILVVIFASNFSYLFVKGINLDTNVLSLLPKTESSPIINLATNKMSKSLSDRLVFLINSQSEEDAFKAANLFAQKLKENKRFARIIGQIDSTEQVAWGSLYFPYRLSLLTEKDQKLLEKNNFQQIKTNALAKIYSPMGIVSEGLLKTDPFFLFLDYMTSLPKPQSHLVLKKGYLTAKDNGKLYIMLTAELKGNSFSLSEQEKIVQFSDTISKLVKAKYPSVSILHSGMVYYAKAGADQAQKDVSVIGVGSIIGIILLVLITFRSLSPLLFTLISAGVGFLSAFVVTLWVFDSVYLFTLVFGASLIGISVDYAFFYYADRLLGGEKWRASNGLKRILPGISLGLINVIVAYLIISLAPFPGLRQLALFSIIGLFMAYLTVISLFPLVLSKGKTKKPSFILKISNAYLNLWQKVKPKTVVIFLIILLIISIFGILKLKPNDDLRILENMPVKLTQMDKKIKTIIGSNLSTSFIVISGVTPNEVITRESKLATLIKQNFPQVYHPFLAISNYVLPESQQNANYELNQRLIHNKITLEYLTSIGLDTKNAQNIINHLKAIKYKPITVNDWLDSKASDSLSFLWLGKFEHQYATVMLLSNELDQTKLQSIAKSIPYVLYINKVNDINHVFKTYRIFLSWLLVCAFGILFLLLFARYGLKKAFIYFLVPVVAQGLSLAVMGFLGVPLTLFSILALILVLGIGVDYVLFFAESKSIFQSTMLAVLLSAVTTTLSFGLLVFSSTPVVYFFGLTVLTGILSSFLLSPIVVALNKPTS